jgi:hypothetical protein
MMTASRSLRSPFGDRNLDLFLARISHQSTTAKAHLPESTALRSEKVLDVLYACALSFRDPVKNTG